mmetsp:Transcript_4662/g.11244  ORF Transcript_4662/g.11244 Transcript_4662/m.11244 type:complete len:232 (+) Transcript_4662:911-1606(+)
MIASEKRLDLLECPLWLPLELIQEPSPNRWGRLPRIHLEELFALRCGPVRVYFPHLEKAFVRIAEQHLFLDDLDKLRGFGRNGFTPRHAFPSKARPQQQGSRRRRIGLEGSGRKIIQLGQSELDEPLPTPRRAHVVKVLKYHAVHLNVSLPRCRRHGLVNAERLAHPSVFGKSHAGSLHSIKVRVVGVVEGLVGPLVLLRFPNGAVSELLQNQGIHVNGTPQVDALVLRLL